jgi:transcriptional regulator with XRE-family HTH domain
MDFGQRLNSIFAVLNCSNAEIARLSSIDSSIISRFRTGTRVPRSNSTQFIKLCEGLADFAEKNNLWLQLKGELDISGESSKQEEICQYLLPSANRRPGPEGKSSFADKLNMLMKITDITNIRLAKALNIDNSLISRFRNGFRTPSKTGSIINELCEFIYKRALSCGCEAKLAGLLDVPLARVLSGGEDFLAFFADWLMDSIDNKTINLIDTLLDKIAAAMKAGGKFVFPLNDSEKAALAATVKEYRGQEGLRTALIKFFGSVLDAGQPGSIRLYTNTKIENLIDEQNYNDRLREIIKQTLTKGSQLSCFNDTDMSIEELCEDLEKSLPLYMTGQFSSYYGRGAAEGRFTNFILTAAESSAVTANIVRGTEATGKYGYFSSEEELAYYDSQLQALMQQARPLAQVFNDKSIDRYYYRLGEAADRPGETHKILLSLSIGTMPKPLFTKMLTRSGILPSKKEKILYLHDIRTRQFYRELQNGGVTEYLVLPEDDMLFSGKVKMNMAEMLIDLPIAYTSDDYSEHVGAIVKLLRENENYNIVVLQENLYSNLQILFKDNAGTMLVRSEEPTAALCLEHPLMNSAFKTYINLIERKSIISAGNKPSVLNELKKYLTYI